MTITYTVEKNDLIAFRKYHQKNDSTYKIGFYLVLAVYGVIILFRSIKYIDNIPFFIFDFAFQFIIFFVLLKVFLFFFAKFNDWLLWRPEKQKGLLCEHTVTLAEDFFIETTAVNESKHIWSGIYKIDQDETCIYIYISAANAYQIPKRAFQSAKDAQEFFEYAKLLAQKGKK